jgi:hypothetical protein
VQFTGETLDSFSLPYLFGTPVSEASDHSIILVQNTISDKH